MPELPEVETIVRGLRTCALGRRVASVHVGLARMAEPSDAILQSGLLGRRLVECYRRAKYIVITIDNGDMLRIHLRMTGRLIFVSAQAAADPPPRYTHITLSFDDGSALYFADARTFGRMTLLKKDDPWDADLGLEPLEPEFTAQMLQRILSQRRGAIKTVLLDQRWIAGIGNIYACEALWQSKIPPDYAAADLSKTQVKRLYTAIRKVLALAVEMRGTSARDYVDAEGLKGGFQNVLTVYGKHGSPCARCKGLIVRTVLGQRGTWWCPQCQVL